MSPFSSRGALFTLNRHALFILLQFGGADPRILQRCNTLYPEGLLDKGQSEASDHLSLREPHLLLAPGAPSHPPRHSSPTGRGGDSAGIALSREYVPSLQTHV